MPQEGATEYINRQNPKFRKILTHKYIANPRSARQTRSPVRRVQERQYQQRTLREKRDLPSQPQRGKGKRYWEGGFRYNPNARLDTSSIRDLRSGRNKRASDMAVAHGSVGRYSQMRVFEELLENKKERSKRLNRSTRGRKEAGLNPRERALLRRIEKIMRKKKKYTRAER